MNDPESYRELIQPQGLSRQFVGTYYVLEDVSKRLEDILDGLVLTESFAAGGESPRLD